MEELKSRTEAIGLLKELVDIISRPDEVRAMHDTARSQMALTLDEKDRCDRARALIMNGDRLQAELNLRSHNISEVEKSLSERLAAVSEREKIVTEAEEAVSKRVANQAEIDKRRLDERKQLDKDKAEFQKFHFEKRTALDVETAKIENDKKTIFTEKQNIAIERKTLKEALDKIRKRTE